MLKDLDNCYLVLLHVVLTFLGKPKYSEKTCPSAAFSTTNPPILPFREPWHPTEAAQGWDNRPLVAAVPSGPNWIPPPSYQLINKLYFRRTYIVKPGMICIVVGKMTIICVMV
jgi:hypothetical protein